VDTTSVVDDSLRGADDNHIGKWVRSTSGANDGATRQVSDYDSTLLDITVAPGFAAVVPDAMTFELWKQQYDPRDIDAFIDQAILSAYGDTYDPEEDISLRGDGYTARFDIPSQFAMLKSVKYRRLVDAVEIHPSSRVFDESVDADFTVALDTEDKKEGNESVRFTIAGTVSAGDIASDSISSLDLSKYDTVEFWAKVETAVAAADLRLRLSATANGATETEALDIPALAARTWTHVRIALANPEDDRAIISVALEYNANAVANTVWLGRIQGVVSDSAVWEPLGRHQWSVDRQARDLILTEGARIVIGPRLIKLIGGDVPLIPTSDASVNEIDDQFVIAKATALGLLGGSVGRDLDPDDRRQLGQYWDVVAERRRRAFPSLQNVRQVE
jgi:hypothetical protein